MSEQTGANKQSSVHAASYIINHHQRLRNKLAVRVELELEHSDARHGVRVRARVLAGRDNRVHGAAQVARDGDLLGGRDRCVLGAGTRVERGVQVGGLGAFGHVEGEGDLTEYAMLAGMHMGRENLGTFDPGAAVAGNASLGNALTGSAGLLDGQEVMNCAASE